MKWTSNAEWPREAYANGVSTDTHDTLEQALAVCSRLEREGFGGDRVHFPLRTWVEEADQEATPALDLSQFEGMTEGPWIARNSNIGLIITNADNDGLATVGKWAARDAENAANHRAIAAVPALIAEVKRLREEKELLAGMYRLASEERDDIRAEVAQREILEAESVGERERLRADNTALRADVERLTRERDEWERSYLSRAEEVAAGHNELRKMSARIAELERDRERLQKHLKRATDIAQRFSEELSTYEWNDILEAYSSLGTSDEPGGIDAAMQTNPEP